MGAVQELFCLMASVFLVTRGVQLAQGQTLVTTVFLLLG